MGKKKIYCPYCDVYLVHNSLRSRRDHADGWKHKTAFQNYFARYFQNNMQQTNEIFEEETEIKAQSSLLTQKQPSQVNKSPISLPVALVPPKVPISIPAPLSQPVVPKIGPPPTNPRIGPPPFPVMSAKIGPPPPVASSTIGPPPQPSIPGKIGPPPPMPGKIGPPPPFGVGRIVPPQLFKTGPIPPGIKIQHSISPPFPSKMSPPPIPGPPKIGPPSFLQNNLPS